MAFEIDVRMRLAAALVRVATPAVFDASSAVIAGSADAARAPSIARQLRTMQVTSGLSGATDFGRGLSASRRNGGVGFSMQAWLLRTDSASAL